MNEVQETLESVGFKMITSVDTGETAYWQFYNSDGERPFGFRISDGKGNVPVNLFQEDCVCQFVPFIKDFGKNADYDFESGNVPDIPPELLPMFKNEQVGDVVDLLHRVTKTVNAANEFEAAVKKGAMGLSPGLAKMLGLPGAGGEGLDHDRVMEMVMSKMKAEGLSEDEVMERIKGGISVQLPGGHEMHIKAVDPNSPEGLELMKNLKQMQEEGAPDNVTIGGDIEHLEKMINESEANAEESSAEPKEDKRTLH